MPFTTPPSWAAGTAVVPCRPGGPGMASPARSSARSCGASASGAPGARGRGRCRPLGAGGREAGGSCPQRRVGVLLVLRRHRTWRLVRHGHRGATGSGASCGREPQQGTCRYLHLAHRKAAAARPPEPCRRQQPFLLAPCPDTASRVDPLPQVGARRRSSDAGCYLLCSTLACPLARPRHRAHGGAVLTRAGCARPPRTAGATGR